MADDGNLNSLVKGEHISPNSTGDNITAKKVANYVWDNVNSVWIRQTSGGGGTSADVNVADVGGSAVSLGQTTKSASLPVTLASDQGATAENLTQINGNPVVTAANGLQTNALSDGMNTANIVANDSGYNGIVENEGVKTLTASSTGTGAQVLLADTDVRGYASIRIVWSAVGSGLAATAQFANASGGTYANSSHFTQGASATTFPGNSGISSGVRYVGPVIDSFFRINITALTSGTATVTVTLSTAPYVSDSTTTQGSKTNNNAAPAATQLDVMPALANAAAPTWSEGFSVKESVDLAGNQRVKSISESATGAAVPANATYLGYSGASGNLTGFSSTAVADNTNQPLIAMASYNGVGGDKNRNNITGALLAAGQTSTQTSSAITTYNTRYLTLLVNISAFTSGTLIITVNGSSSSSYTYLMLTSAALGAAATTALQIGPGLPATTNVSANAPLPRTFTVTATLSGGGSLTYGIDYILSV